MKPVATTPRAARIQLERVKDLLGHLRMSRLALVDLEHETAGIDRLIDEAMEHLNLIHQIAKMRIEPRRRQSPKVRVYEEVRPSYTLYLDECGSHITKSINMQFPLFCLSGVIVADGGYELFDSKWQSWKQQILGTPDAIVHEPDVRHHNGYFHGDTIEQSQRKGNC